MPVWFAQPARPHKFPTAVRVLLAAALLLLAVAASAHAKPLFRALFMSFESGGRSVAVADLDGDGLPDLAVASGSVVSVLLGKGDGTFRARTDFALSSGSNSLAIADFNADGWPDLAVANGGYVSVMLGNGDGTFGARTDLGTGGTPLFVAIGDVNADGRQDLATANWGAYPSYVKSVSVFLGNGDGTFGARADLGTRIGPRSVAIVDLNADGRPDLAVANEGLNPESPGSAAVFFGNGDGTFGPQTDFGVGGSYPFSVASADLNADGRADLALVNAGASNLSVLLSNGDGTFRTRADFATGGKPYSLAIADLNGDGRPDLATANHDVSTVSVLLGNGDGTFGAKTDFPAQQHPYCVTIADLNADGRPDLAVANAGSSTVSVMLGNGDGTFGTTTARAAGSGLSSMAIADLDADGRLDLALSSYSSITVLLGHGDGTFGMGADYGNGSDPRSVAIADLNADGHADIAAANLTHSAMVLLGNGDGTFGTMAVYGTQSTASSVAIKDLNGDARADLAVTNSGSNTVSVLYGFGDGTFGARGDFGTGWGPSSVAIADLNADGWPDLAVATVNYTVSVVLGNGGGRFGAKTDFGTGGRSSSVAIADLNADGRPDLAVANTYSSTVSVLLGNGDGTFATKIDFGTGISPQSLAIADIDLDGRPDIAVANIGSYEPIGRTGFGTVSVLLGNGDGTFGGRIDYGTGYSPASVAVADLNRDGRPDLAVGNYGFNGSTVSVLLGERDFPTAVLLSVMSKDASPERVILRWQGEGAANLSATVYRRAPTGEWEHLGTPTAEGADILRYEDRAVSPGVRYNYRLGYREGDAEHFTPEIEVEVPLAFRLALEGFQPNPTAGRPMVAFTLADDSPAVVEVLDVAGRRVLRHDMRGMGPGRQVIRLEGGGRLAAGVYMMRLHQAGRIVHARGVVIE